MFFTDIRVGMLVQQSDSYSGGFGNKFIGTIDGITVNSVGEAIPIVTMVIRNIGRHIGSEGMKEMGYTRAACTSKSADFWQRTDAMHHANLAPLTDPRNLMDDTNG